MSLDTRDRQEIAGLARDLAVLDLDGPPLVRALADRLLALLRTEGTLVYSPRWEDAGWSLGEFALAGLGAPAEGGLRAGFDDWLRRSSGAWAYYDPRNTEPAQRNRVLAVGTWRQLAENRLPAALARAHLSREERDRRARSVAGARAWFEQWGTIEAEQLRVIICDGPAMLAWVGGLQHAAFDPRAKRALAALVGPLRRRFALEARLGAPAASPLVPALLEEIPTAAYVLDGTDGVVASNTAGRRALEADPRRGRALRSARHARGDANFTAVELASRGVPRHALLIERVVDAPPALAAVGLAASRFGLTAREAEVLGHLARGMTNRAIAAALGCSERTVETHVHHILAKSDYGSRAQLVAALWALAPR